MVLVVSGRWLRTVKFTVWRFYHAEFSWKILHCTCQNSPGKYFIVHVILLKSVSYWNWWRCRMEPFQKRIQEHQNTVQKAYIARNCFFFLELSEQRSGAFESCSFDLKIRMDFSETIKDQRHDSWENSWEDLHSKSFRLELLKSN